MNYQKRLNPYHHRERNSSLWNRVRTWGSFLVGGTALVLFITLLPVWQITAVEVSGPLNPAIPIQKTMGDYFSSTERTFANQRNILFLSKGDLKQALETAYSTDKIEIDKDFPRTLRVTLNDPGATAVFIARGKTYSLDPYGKIIGPVNRQSANALTIYDAGATMPAAGAEVLRPEFMQFLATVQNHESFRGYRIKYALSPTVTDESTVTLATDKGFRIIIDSTADLSEQLARMNRIVNQVVGSSKLATLDYIDLRFKEKVFYKTK